MFRSNSFARYRAYVKSLKYFKNNTKTNNDFLNRDVNQFLNDAATNSNAQKGFLQNLKLDLNKISSRISNKNDYLYSVQSTVEDRKLSAKNKYNQLTHEKKGVQKLCANLLNKRENVLYMGTAGISVAASETIHASQSIDPIPEPPPVPDLPPELPLDLNGGEAVEVLNQFNALGEASLASLGLGGYSPVGIVQQCLEYVHVSMGLDWWASIAIGTIVIRTLLFPLVIIAQRNAAKMNNYLPQMQAIQMKMTEARQTGNALDAARYSQELMVFMQQKGLNPLKNMVVPLAQMPVFVSFFMGLRQMANVPVDSLRTGGLWWFSDLTMPDQYFIMPVITSITLWATIELGTDSAKLSAQNMVLMKYVLRALPLVVLPFTVNFPGVVLCYWVSSNFISLLQVGILRIPKVRDYFKIEPLVTHKPDNLPMKPKGFREGLTDSWTNIKITKELEERRRLDDIQFQRAGRGPIVKTYKSDPTKQIDPNTPSPISAKKR